MRFRVFRSKTSGFQNSVIARRKQPLSNIMLQTTSVLVLLAHIATLVWALLRRDIRPVLWLNLCAAAGVWLYWAPRLGRVFDFADGQVFALLALTLVTAATSIAALCGLRIPAFLIWLQFAVQATASALAVVFAFTFRITRLF